MPDPPKGLLRTGTMIASSPSSGLIARPAIKGDLAQNGVFHYSPPNYLTPVAAIILSPRVS